MDLLSMLELANRSNHRALELSGGEQQRVAIARALMNSGRILLADEPTAALDAKNEREIVRTLEQLCAQGHTVVLATHNPHIASRADRRIDLTNGRVTLDSGPKRATNANRHTLSLADGPSCSSPRTAGLFASAVSAVGSALSVMRNEFIRGKRLRSALTIASIVAGVWLGTMSLSIGTGIIHDFMDGLSELDLHMIYVFSGNPDTGEQTELTLADARELERLPNVRAVSPSLQRHDITLRFGDASTEATVQAFVDQGFQTQSGVWDWRLDQGEHLTHSENENSEPVALIGWSTSQFLFPAHLDPIGQQVLIDSQPFRVKGVLEKRLLEFPESMSENETRQYEAIANNHVFVPYKTGAALLFGTDNPEQIVIYLHDKSELVQTAIAVRDLLFQRHGVEGFDIDHVGGAFEYTQHIRRQLLLSLGGISVLALLVGGSCLASVMLMSITARVREIGIRLAVGARPRDVMSQFVLEAVAMTTVGGLFGALVSVIFILVLNAIELPLDLSPWSPGVPVSLSFWILAVPLACSIAIGLLFGILPARRAARLDPVSALAAD